MPPQLLPAILCLPWHCFAMPLTLCLNRPCPAAVPLCLPISFLLQTTMSVKSLLDTVDVVWERDDLPVADDNSSIFQQQTTTAAAPSSAMQGDDTQV